jgi:pimeloyl-ACP methyl ester carboxylesterase
MARSSQDSAQRIVSTVSWMRTEWGGRETIHLPLETSPGISSALHAEARAPEGEPGQASTPSAIAAGGLLPPVVLGRPTALALVGHSWGARAAARVAADIAVRVEALAAIAGSFDDNESIAALRAVQVPTLLMSGTEDSEAFSYLHALWEILPRPRYQAAFQGVGHWDWFGRSGAIRRCDGAQPAWPETGHIAGELLVGFLTRHVARLQFDPPHFVNIPLLRPWLSPWHDVGSAIQVRWDAPGQRFFPLPPAGAGILGLWTQSAPW